MEFIEFAKELYSTELYSQLHKAYEKRCQELAASFSLSLQRLEQSEILQEMGGEELIKYRLEHISQITKQVMLNQQEMHIEQYLRTISQLKAQLAIERKKFELLGKKTEENDLNPKNAKEQPEINTLKKQQSCKDLFYMNPENSPLGQKKNKNTKLHADDKEVGNKLLIEKYDQVLQIEKKKSEQSLKQQKQRYQTTIQALEKQNENLKGMNLRLNQENKKLLQRLEELTRKVQTPKLLLNPSLSMKQLKTTEYQELEHFNPRTKKEIPYIYQISDDSPSFVQAQKLQPKESLTYTSSLNRPHSAITKNGKDTFESTQHLNQDVSPRWPLPVTKFDEIKSSFAKELASLRTKMSDNRQKLHSPDFRRRSRVPLARESSVQKKVQSPSRYTPHKYGLKTYHHY